jgi:hypothetical protein
MRERLIEIFSAHESAENAARLADVILELKDRKPGLCVEVIDRKIIEYSLDGDDRTYLEDIRDGIQT